MSLVRYAADHVAALFVTVASILAVQLVLRGAGMGDSVLAFVTVILVASALARLLVSYFARRSFWRSVGRHIVREGPEGREAAGPLSMPDLVEEPHFLEGRLAWEAFDALAQDFRSRIDAVRSEGADYRTFVEAWVHEVKTPIAAARLMADNNPGALSSAMLRELGRIDGYVEQALYYARSGSLDRDYVVRELPLSQVVRDALRTHARSLIDRGVSVSAQGLDLVVFSDAKWVAFILGQLVENAAKYRAPTEGPGARGAVLTLRATRHDVGRARGARGRGQWDGHSRSRPPPRLRQGVRGREGPLAVLVAVHGHRTLPGQEALRQDGPARVHRVRVQLVDAGEHLLPHEPHALRGPDLLVGAPRLPSGVRLA